MEPNTPRSLIRSSWFFLVCASTASISSQQNDRLSAPFRATSTSLPAFWTGAGTTDVFYKADQVLDGNELPLLYRAALDGSGTASVAGRPDWSSFSHISIVVADRDHVLAATTEVIDPYEGYDEVTLSMWVSGRTNPVVLFQQDGDYLDDIEFRVSADGTSVALVYWIPYLTPHLRLFGGPVDQSSPFQLLDEGVGNFVITPDGSRVVYGSGELRSVPIDRSQPPLILADAYPEEIQTTPDGSRALYRTSSGLFSVPVDASAPPVQLSGPLVSGGHVSAFQIAPDGTRAVYLADQVVDERFELFEVSVDGRAGPRRLHRAMPATADVQSDFRISPDSRHVVYRADRTTDDIFALYSAELGRTPRARALGEEASSAPLSPRISAPLVTGGDVLSFQISPDGSRVAYLADGRHDERFEVFGVPIDGSALAVPLNGNLVPGGNVQQYVFSGDGERVAFRADKLTDEHFELFVAPSNGSAAAQRLSDGGEVQPDVARTSDGSRVVYRADRNGPDAFELFSVPFDGSAAPDRVNDDLDSITTGDVGGFQITPDGAHVLYGADADQDEVDELFSVDVTQPGQAVKLNAPLGVRGPYTFNLLSLSITPDSARTLYVADEERQSSYGLYSVPTDGSASRIKLSGTHSPRGPGSLKSNYATLAPLGRALYVDTRAQLYSVPVDGSLAPARLDLAGTGPVSLLEVPASGTRAVFTVGHVYEDLDTWLFSVPVDGSAAAVPLAPPLPSFQYIRSRSIKTTPDGTRVVYVADQDVQGRLELYSVPTDGSASVIKLNGTLVTGGDVVSLEVSSSPREWFEISPDGSHVIYRADQDTDERFELYSAPIDGSAPAVKLNGTLVAGGNVVSDPSSGKWFEVCPDSSRVVYRADQNSDEVFELFSVPIDGSAPPTRLHPQLVTGGDVTSYGFSPDGSRVAYIADQESDEVFELYSAPSDGSAPAVKLSGLLAPSGDVAAFLFDANGSRIVYQANVNNGSELDAVSSAGGTPIRVSAAGAFVSQFWMRPGGNWVLYLRLGGQNRLFLAPLDASSAPILVSGPMGLSDPTGRFRFSTDGAFLVYLSDQLVAERFELFRTLLP